MVHLLRSPRKSLETRNFGKQLGVASPCGLHVVLGDVAYLSSLARAPSPVTHLGRGVAVPGRPGHLKISVLSRRIVFFFQFGS